jgi:PDZ domain-containing protein
VIRLSPGRLAAAGGILLAIVALVLWLTPSDSYIFLPDPAHPVEPLVRVQGGKEPAGSGGIYYVDVFVRKASWLERLFPGLHDGASLQAPGNVKPPCVSDAELRQADLNEMQQSQQIAAAVALRTLGYKVEARSAGAQIVDVACDAPAARLLEPTDVVISVDGHPVRTPSELRTVILRHRPGQTVHVVVRRGHNSRALAVRTVADPNDPSRAIVGIRIVEAASIHLPRPVRINAGKIGGPSAGLAFALEVMEKLGRDVDHGLRVAATGELQLDGHVLAIGGIQQKTIGARQSHVDVFLVPAGENARAARRVAHGLRIVPVTSFQQALHALATVRGSRS